MDIQDRTHYLPQAFDDMIRVSNNLLIDTLICGMVVDSVVYW